MIFAFPWPNLNVKILTSTAVAPYVITKEIKRKVNSLLWYSCSELSSSSAASAGMEKKERAMRVKMVRKRKTVLGITLDGLCMFH